MLLINFCIRKTSKEKSEPWQGGWAVLLLLLTDHAK